MNERDFVIKKREAWDRLAALIRKANSRSGIKSLSREEILALGPLYRRVSSDLAYARAHAVSNDLILHLNGMVGQTYALLYEAETSGKPLRAALDFYLYEFPAVLQRRYRYFLAALAISVFGALFGYWLVIHHPARIDLFIPEGLKSSVDAWKSGNVAEEAHIDQSGALMTHNLQVGLMSFALGIVIVPDVVMMFTNGGMLGAMGALMTQVHHHDTFWPGIVPHGIAELTAIFICGAAGFVLAMGFIAPGRLSRLDGIRLAGMDAIKMVLGTIPLFIFAGMIEGMFSHLATPPWFRYLFAVTNGIFWYLYLFLPRQRPGTAPVAPKGRNLPAAGSVEA